VSGSSKGRNPQTHGVQSDPARPNVNFNAVVALAGDHFRRRVAWAPARSFQRLACFVGVRKTEIHYFEVLLFVQQQVFRLQVPVCDSFAVQKFNPTHNLVVEAASFLFA